MDVLLTPRQGRWALIASTTLNFALLAVLLWPDSTPESVIEPVVEPIPVAESIGEVVVPTVVEPEHVHEEPEAVEVEVESAKAPTGVQVTVASIEGSIPQTMASVAAPYGDFLSATLSRVLVWDHDLRRDLRAGDKVEVAWSLGTSDTVVIESARFHSQKFNRITTAYRFKATGDEHPSYWSADGVEIPHRLRHSPLADYEQITSLLKDRPTHKGMDFKADVGTPVVASFAGVVTRTNWNWNANGNCIEIKHDDGVFAKYLHLSDNKVKAGDRVKPGQLIALSGNTGRSTGPHLHYQLNRGARGKVVDPIAYHKTDRCSLPEADKAAFAEHVNQSDARLSGHALATR